MMTDDEQRKMAMLQATLSEILSIDTEAGRSSTSIPGDQALDGPLLARWTKIKRQALHVLAMPGSPTVRSKLSTRP